MRQLTSRRLAVRLLAVFACFASCPSANAQSAPAEATVEVCTQAYSAGQEERLRGNRLKAIERFAVCSASSCPGVVVSDCSKWLREVQAELSSVRFEAKDSAGRRLSSVDIYLDDQAVTLSNDGSALVPPGEHEFRFEAPEHQPAKVQRSLGVGERDVVITAVLVPLAPEPSSEAPSPRPAAKKAPPREEPSGGGIPAASIVAGSLGLISFGIAAGFGVSARSDYYELERDCAPDCSSQRADSVSRKALIADVALVTGAIAVGAAIWIYVQHDDSGDVAVGIAPGPGGSQARLRTTF